MLKQFQPLEHRNPDFSDIVPLRDPAGAFFDCGEAPRLRTVDILETSKPRQLHVNRC